jgi:hypothetical protein
MEPGVPVDVRQGYCFLNTEFKQSGRTLNRDDVMQRLAKNEKTGPYAAQGNTLAVGSVVATVVATPAILVVGLAKDGDIHMSDGASTGLLNENLTRPREQEDDRPDY